MQNPNELLIEEKRARLRAHLEKQKLLSSTYLPASPAQHALWGFSLVNPDSLAYHIKFSVIINPAISSVKIKQAVVSLMEQHPILKSRFLINNKQLFNVYDQPSEIDFTETHINDNNLESQMLADFSKPFYLEKGNLLRASLYTIDENKQVLLLVAHHIILDGFSLLRLIRELGENINALLREQPVNLEPGKIDFRHYLRYQNQLINSDHYQESEKFWVEHLKSVPKILSLPYSYKRQSPPVHQGETVTISLSSEKVLQLKSLASKYKVTLQVILLAIYKLTLTAISNSKTILCATPTLGRDKEEFLSLIGYFANTIVIKSEINDEQSILEFINSTRTTLYTALKHQCYHFSDLIKQFENQREIASFPITQVGFAFHQPITNSEENLSDPQWGDSIVTPFRFGPTAFYQLDLYVVALELMNNEISFSFGYLIDVFNQETIQAIANHYFTLIDIVLNNINTSIKNLPFYASAERFRNYITQQYNNTDQFITDLSLINLCLNTLSYRSQSIAVIDANGSYTYQDLFFLSFGIAQQINQFHRGEPCAIGILLEKGVLQVASALAVIFSGNYFVPLNLDIPSERLKTIFKQAKIGLILTTQALSQKYPLDELKIIDVAATQPSDYFNTTTNSAQALAYVIFTSGTTGIPKGVVISQRSLVHNVLAINKKFHITENDKLFAVSNFGFDLAMYDIFGLLLAGGCIVFGKQDEIKEPKQWLDIVNTYQITLWNSVPMLFSMLLKQTSQALPLKKIFLSGDWISVDVVKQGHKLCPEATIISLGGPTEITIWSNFYVVQRDIDYDYIPYGFPLPNYRCYILDKDLLLCPENQIGEIYVGGIGVAQGYLNNPELTQQAFIFHPEYGRLYRTGDFGCMTQEYGMRIKGRADAQVKIGGYRIELNEVRSALEKCYPGKAIYCDIVSNHLQTKKIVGYIESSDVETNHYQVIHDIKNHSSLSDGFSLLQEHLPQYMIPNYFILLSHLPLTPNGKLDNKLLATFQQNQVTWSEESIHSDFENTIADIWKKALRLNDQPLYRNNDFFALGGQSLSALEMQLLIKEKFSIDFELKTIFNFPTLKLFCEQLRIQQFNHCYESQSFVVLKSAPSTQPLIVLIHPGTGTIDCYLNFASQFSKDYFLLAIQYKNSSANNLAELAHEYVDAILKNYPNRKIHILGYSLGAHIAFEMAKLMQCESLAVVDAMPISQDEKIYSDFNEQLIESILLNDYHINQEKIPLFMNYVTQRKKLLETLSANYITVGKLTCPTGYFKAKQNPVTKIMGWENCCESTLLHFDCDGTHMTMFSEKHIDSLLQNYYQFLSESRLSC